jgi:hypothetical protein
MPFGSITFVTFPTRRPAVRFDQKSKMPSGALISLSRRAPFPFHRLSFFNANAKGQPRSLPFGHFLGWLVFSVGRYGFRIGNGFLNAFQLAPVAVISRSGMS